MIYLKNGDLMAKIKQNIYTCKDCDIDFIAKAANYCANCGDNLFLERVRYIWLDRYVSRSKRWNLDDDEHLIESVERGISNQEIADELGRTKDAVAERLRRLRKTRVIERGIK